MSIYKIPTRYFYWVGNIFRSQYTNERGFWLVCPDKIARRCDAEGNLITEEQRLYGTSEKLSMKINYAYRPQFLWHDMNAGLYPELDAFNQKERNHYLNSEWTDEKAAPKFKAQDEQRAASVAAYNALPKVEQWLQCFDWTYEESDAYSSAARAAASSARRIFKVLDTMPEEDARALVSKYAYHGQTYDSLKQLMASYPGE